MVGFTGRRVLGGLGIAMLAGVVLAGCKEAEQGGGDGAQQACHAQGGRYERGGMSGEMVCYRPTPDAGRICQTAGDCEGLCLSESGEGAGMCSSERPLFGCHGILGEQGEPVVICID